MILDGFGSSSNNKNSNNKKNCNEDKEMIELTKIVLDWILESRLRVFCISLTVILISDLIYRRWRKFQEFRKRVEKLPGPPICMPILGNIPTKVFSLLTNKSAPNYAGEFYTSQIQSVLGHTIIYRDEQIFRLWIGQEPVVCVWRPEIVELVLGDNFLLEKSYHYDFLRPWLGNGLLTSPGRIWRPRRKLLVPSFHFHILQAFVPVFDRKSKLMVRNIKRKLNEKITEQDQPTDSSNSNSSNNISTVVDITPLITACTLDAICETIMGVTIDAQENPNNEYCQSVYLVGETFLERIIQPQYWLDTLFSWTELGKLYKYHLNKLHSFTREVIVEKKREKLRAHRDASPVPMASEKVSEQQAGGFTMRAMEKTSVDSYAESRKEKPKLPKAFLDLLLEKLNSSTGEQRLTDEEIREEVDTFMFEGHDTTAMALSWTLFLLGHNMQVQRRLQQEVDHLFETQLFGNNDDDDNDNETDHQTIELDQVKKLKYLECVIKEALRLCPSVPFIGRQTTGELKLGEHVIPPGCVIFVLIYQLHRNSETFPNPERFDPDRFLPENMAGRHPFAYVPFSAGPRNCIGQKFAMAEMKTILLNLVRNFEFVSVTPLDKARVQMEMVLRPKCSLDIRIKPRGQQQQQP